MIETITLKEYDQLHIRDRRNPNNNTITKEDAIALQSIIMDEEPVFKWGYKKLIAQHWVGTISLKNLNIEILPKIAGYVSNEDLRNVLTRMLLVSHQSPAVRKLPGAVSMSKNSMIEILIDTFLTSCEKYTSEGMRHSYVKVDQNLNRVKGRIDFNKQFTCNVLNPTRFWCKYSKFTPDNFINQFFKLCLTEMSKVSTDVSNKQRIKRLLPAYEDITVITKEKAILKDQVFNSTNQIAQEGYVYGKMFLQNIFSTLSAGNTKINMMLFDMNSLYESFVYKVAHMAFGNSVTYQMRGNYLLQRDIDSKKHISLRPDITIKENDGTLIILDTKWKIPQRFAKESDAYQMNAYSTSIPKVKEVVLLYPLVLHSAMIDDYHFIDSEGKERLLKIRTIDLMKCLEWKSFLTIFRDSIS